MRYIKKIGQDPKYLLTFRKRKITKDDNSSRKSTYSDFCNNIKFDHLRHMMMESQGYLCAFCMKEIPEKNSNGERTLQEMKVAHWYPQSGELTPEQQLDLQYSNMFAACPGNGNTRKAPNANAAAGRDRHTCDTRQGSCFLVLNPSNQRHIDLLEYDSNGIIYCLSKTEQIGLKLRYDTLVRQKGKDDRNANTGVVNKRLDADDLTLEELKIAIQYDIEENLNLNHHNLQENRKRIYQQTVENYKKAIQYKGNNINRVQKNQEAKRLKEFWLGSTQKGTYHPFCMVAVLYLQKRLH